MPIFGTMDVDAGADRRPLVKDFASQSWMLPGVEYVQVAYEVAHRPALELTPPSLHPSVPPYATFSVMRCPDSPLGPFTLAQVRLVVRAGIRPRALLFKAYCSSEPVAAALAEGWGYHIAVADVRFAFRHDSVRGSVHVGAKTVLEIEAADGEPVGGDDLTLLDNLHLIRLIEGGEPERLMIVQVDPIWTVSTTDRGRPVLRTFDGDAFGTGGKLVVTSPVTSITCRADVELPRPRFVLDPKAPALQSSRKLAIAA
jgi:hypothetical protein